MPFLDEDGVTRLTTDYLDIFALKNNLDATKLTGTIPSANLPSYVDDVLEYAGIANFPVTGEAGKIYVDTTDNNTYRWTGSAYVSISNPLDYATQSEAETGTNNTKVMTPLRTAQEIASKTDSTLSSSSNNPVRNSVIKQALDSKLDTDDYRAGMTWGELEGAVTWGDLEHDLSDTGTDTTENYDLVKPGLNSDAGIGPINDNMDTIDDILADKLDDADYRKAMTWGEVGNKYNWGLLGTTSQTTGTTYTDTLGLEKPGNDSTVDISTINDNYDTIDESVEGTQSSIAMIESATAKSNHAVGSYFMLDNVLHKATSAIASGETITSGSNATPITLEQALNTLNSSVNSLRDSVYKLTSSDSFCKIGRLVIWSQVFASASTSSAPFITVPDGYRPAYSVMNVICVKGSTRTTVPCGVSTNGRVMVYETLSNVRLEFLGAWFTN